LLPDIAAFERRVFVANNSFSKNYIAGKTSANCEDTVFNPLIILQFLKRRFHG